MSWIWSFSPKFKAKLRVKVLCTRLVSWPAFDLDISQIWKLNSEVEHWYSKIFKEMVLMTNLSVNSKSDHHKDTRAKALIGYPCNRVHVIHGHLHWGVQCHWSGQGILSTLEGILLGFTHTKSSAGMLIRSTWPNVLLEFLAGITMELYRSIWSRSAYPVNRYWLPAKHLQSGLWGCSTGNIKLF